MKGKDHPSKKEFIYPDLIFNSILLFYIIMGILVTLTMVKPFGLGDAADPLRSPDVVKPEWYFLAFFQFINYLPKEVGTGIVFLGIFLLCFWPFLPGVKHPNGSGKVRTSFFRIVGVLFVLSYILLTVIGYVAESDRVIFGKKYHFDSRGIPHKVVSEKGSISGNEDKNQQSEKEDAPEQH